MVYRLLSECLVMSLFEIVNVFFFFFFFIPQFHVCSVLPLRHFGVYIKREIGKHVSIPTCVKRQAYCNRSVFFTQIFPLL